MGVICMGLIYIQEFLDCHADDFTEEYLEQLTVQMKQKIKILMLLWIGLSSKRGLHMAETWSLTPLRSTISWI
jgi:hypothetical protein